MKKIKRNPFILALIYPVPIIVISFLLPAIMLWPLLLPAVGLELIGIDLNFGPIIGIGDVMGFYYLPQIIPTWIILYVIGYFRARWLLKRSINKV